MKKIVKSRVVALGYLALMGAGVGACEGLGMGSTGDSGCEAGALGCPCAAGDLCLAGLVCSQGICQGGAGGTGPVDDTGGTNDTADTGADSTGSGGESDTDEPPPPPPNCGEMPLMVSGSLSTSAVALSFDSVVAEVRHKQDVDDFEDGCINAVGLTFQAGSGCTLAVVAEGVLLGDNLQITSIAFDADSQCPGFSDVDEGTYFGPGSADSWVTLSQTKIGEDNVSESCFPGTLEVFVQGIVTDGAKALSFTGGSLVVTGDFPTLALDQACPVECGDGVLEGSEQCDGTDFGGASCQSEGFDEGDLTCNGCIIGTENCASGNPQPNSGLYSSCRSDADCPLNDFCDHNGIRGFCTDNCVGPAECAADLGGMATPTCAMGACLIDCTGDLTCPGGMICIPTAGGISACY